MRLGELSGNHTIQATALDWQGNTYVYLLLSTPKGLFDLFDDALKHLGSNDLLMIEAAIYSNLSVAYAQKGDEIKAMKYAVMARNDNAYIP